ncbi:unnamed protein product [Closterium sp. NIES-64]|nr:unnamed protein product [Closterium sp. NIES-64]CAI6000321.1 unnamed protein product [Closterium sp. NIES-65]
MKSSAAIVFLGLILAALCCSVQAHGDGRGGRGNGRFRWPILIASGESSLKSCPRVYGVRGSAALKNYQSQNGSLTLTYQLLVTGTTSAPTSQSVVTGNPCDTLVTPTTVTDLPGTWTSIWVRRGTAYTLYGTMDGAALMAGLQNTNGRRRAPKMFVVFRGNGTISGKLDFW